MIRAGYIPPDSDERGFTLVELMVVVAILGVLAVLAVVTYKSYIKRARTSEAVTNLGAIAAKEEAYFQEFLQYCDVSDPHPASIPTFTKLAWGPAPGSNWEMLGWRASGAVQFQYDVTAGPPNDGAMPAGVGLDPAQHWFVASATGDQDGDTTDFSLFELTSNRKEIYSEKELE